MLLFFYLLVTAVSATSLNPHVHRRDGIFPVDNGTAIQMTTIRGHYPRANYLSDGSILGSFVEPDQTTNISGNTTIKVVKSLDNGTTWYGNTTVYTNATFTNDIDNPYPIQLPSGRILLIYRNHYRFNFLNETLYRLSISYSDDCGDTWTFQGDAVTKVPSVPYGGVPEGIWEPFLRFSQNGSLQLYYSNETSADGLDQDSMMRTSKDGGLTWSAAKTISGANVTARDGMLGVVNTGGSNLIAVFETTEDPNYQFVVDSVMSPDDGATWGNRSRVFTPSVVGKSAGSPQVIDVGGTIVASFMNSENSTFNGYNGTAATILTSSDGGRSWGNKDYVFPMWANEPGMLVLKDTSSFLVMTSLEAQAQTTYDGTLKSQKLVLS